MCLSAHYANGSFRSGGRKEKAFYVGAPSHEQAAATPAMPPARQIARLISPVIRPGPIADLYLSLSLRRISTGHYDRAARFEYVERAYRQHLVTEIDPSRLKRRLIDVISDGTQHARLSHWFLDGADWEQALVPLNTSDVHQEMEAVFQPPEALSDTPAYRKLLSLAASGRPQTHNGVSLTSPELIINYFEHYRNLKDSISQHGFLSRHDVLHGISDQFSDSKVRSKKAELREREVGVAIAADGELVRMVGGHHRTAIAQHLKLSRIPIQIRLVHKNWLFRQMHDMRLSPKEALVASIRKLSFGFLGFLAWSKSDNEEIHIILLMSS